MSDSSSKQTITVITLLFFYWMGNALTLMQVFCDMMFHMLLSKWCHGNTLTSYQSNPALIPSDNIFEMVMWSPGSPSGYFSHWNNWICMASFFLKMSSLYPILLLNHTFMSALKVFLWRFNLTKYQQQSLSGLQYRKHFFNIYLIYYLLLTYSSLTHGLWQLWRH